ncbi:expressed unknown protein [Ectocarpus siliculosus]|uniref:Uncharacterized protein n=1 Tax=Ectocarpus siliculosus TaxID=2880 RepID=D7FX64_ECTSI|nr:expressed unknown protein [Ectocarpus siliculosus]|eukprot:CBJ26397.1 expressed unknown protein [Ectocarpus siliculosus]
MGALWTMTAVLMGSMGLCGLYSGMDIKFGEKGFYCWSAFSLLITVLSSSRRGVVAAVLLAAGKGFGVEPFAVLTVSLLVSKALCSNAFSGNKPDDDPVPRKPYEEEIRELLFQNDPSRLHLVDSELRQYKGRERELLRRYQARYAPDPPMPAANDGPGRTARGERRRGGGGMVDDNQGYHRGDSGNARRNDVKERAREEEQRRVQASLDASLDRILGRRSGRR